MNRLLMKRNGLQGFGEHTSKKIPDRDWQLMSEQLERENCKKGNCRTIVESYLKRVLNPQLSRNQLFSLQYTFQSFATGCMELPLSETLSLPNSGIQLQCV